MNTNQEVLIAELLGDVGKLHNEIKLLPESMAPTIGAIVSASKEAKTSIDGYVESQKAVFREFNNQERLVMRNELRSNIQEEAGRIIRNAAQALETSAQVHKHTQRGERCLLAITALCIGIISAMVGLYGYHMYYGQQMAAEASTGRSLNIAWPRLDEKARNIILEEISKQK